jgi:FtsP/CotA-like multicopper oxidase with cupredoxin domain
MKALSIQTGRLTAGLVLMLLSMATLTAQAAILGITGPTFNLSAGTAQITTPDGDSLQIWGYGDGVPQYPGPTLIVNQGDTVTINLTNNLPQPTSMVFPGQADDPTTPADESVTASTVPPNLCPGASGCLLTEEAAASGGMATYTFTATHAGTYMYHSGTNIELQTEMGLFGVIIVRPTGFDEDEDTKRIAYGDQKTGYDHEYLLLLSEMDPLIHYQVEFNAANSLPLTSIDFTDYRPKLWFVNGRNFPDTLAPDNLPWMPHQPYGALALTQPGDIVLSRLMGASHHPHPIHTHGNNFTIIARDGRVLTTTPGGPSEVPDLARSEYTYNPAPFQTFDTVWGWTGKGLGWDIYGHLANDMVTCTPNGDGYDDYLREWCDDHNKPIPVILPELQDVTIGAFYSGSPYLGVSAALPPGEGGLNLTGGLFFMWHSHTEKELVNNDIFPGGMLTEILILPPGIL